MSAPWTPVVRAVWPVTTPVPIVGMSKATPRKITNTISPEVGAVVNMICVPPLPKL